MDSRRTVAAGAPVGAWAGCAALQRRRDGGVLAYSVLALFVFMGMSALAVDIGHHYSRKGALQPLADMAAFESLATTDPALSKADEDANIRKFVANIASANGYARDFFRVKTFECTTSGYACGCAHTDHAHTSSHSSECITNCDGGHQHTGHDTEHEGTGHESEHESEHEGEHESGHEHSSLLPADGLDPNAMPRLSALAIPNGKFPMLGSFGVLSQPETPAWMQPGAINLADAHESHEEASHGGHGNDTHGGHAGHGVPSEIKAPDTTDICRVEVSATVDSPSFFAHIFRITSVRVGVYAAAERNYSVTTTSSARNCAFYGQISVSLGGGGNECIDSYFSASGDYATQLAACGSSCNVTGSSGGCTRALGRSALGCSDGVFDYNGNITHLGGTSAVGNVSISGSSHLIEGDVATAGTFTVSGQENVTGTISQGASVSPLSLTPVTFAEAPSYPYIPTGNDNSTSNITGYVNTTQLASKVLQDSTGNGPNPGCDPLNPTDRKAICLAAGKVYYFTKVCLGSNTNVRIVGTSANPTRIYLDNAAGAQCSGNVNFNFGGGFFNTTTNASTLKIYGGSTTGRTDGILSIPGNSSLSADVYAPLLTVRMRGGGGQLTGGLWGRVFARALDFQGNMAFHYDQSLASLNVGGSTTSTVSRVILVE